MLADRSPFERSGIENREDWRVRRHSRPVMGISVPASRLMGQLDLTGLRILVVEDEMLVSLVVEDALSDHGCIVVGPAATVQDALRIIQTMPIDAAVMDVNISGEKTYPVADTLDGMGIPFLLVSGYGQSAVPRDRPGWRVCAKPFRGPEMIAMLQTQILSKRP